ESQFQNLKEGFKGRILPAMHPESVRVRMISKDIIEALQRGLKKDQVWTDLNYASESGGMSERRGKEAVMAMSEESIGGAKWLGKDEVIDDVWVDESRKKGRDKGEKADTLHLEGLKWEVLVVNDHLVNAFCLPGGKIVVFTGLLKHFRTDEELATIIGHESVEKLLGSYVIIAKVCEQNTILLVGSDSSSAVIRQCPSLQTHTSPSMYGNDAV
nr:peptidase M48 [Tanacetum cinerariifolium]